MMASFALTKQAKSDLKTIARFTEARWGQAQRNVYIKQFDDTFHLLADTPTVGKDCSVIKDGYQKSPQGSHIIFYKTVTHTNIAIKSTETGSIEIIRILHKSMDVESTLSNL